MKSLFWASGIYGMLAIGIACIKKKEGTARYNGMACMAGYLLSRLFVFLQLRQMEAVVWSSMVLDMAFFVLLSVLAWKHCLDLQWESVWLYLTNPVILLSLSSVKKMSVVVILVLALLTVIKRWGIRRWEKHSLKLFGYYIAYTVCGMMYLAARMLLNQSGSQCAAGDDVYPMLWIFAMALTILTTIHFGFWLAQRKENIETETEEKWEAVEEQEHTVRDEWNGRDIVLMILLTLCYGILAFYRLGSTEAPQTYRVLSNASEEERQMIFRFGADTELDKIEIFLGVESKPKISFSWYNFSTDEWEVFDSKRSIESVFTWNTVPVDRTVRTMAMVLMDEKAYIHEIVFLDKNGNRVLPVNWSDYAEVFDEQDCYPDYVTYYEGTMFDEVYHARTAYEFVHKLPIYEITHPPLGKLLISVGIRIFGMTPFGWRIVCALFGTGMVPLMYLFIRKISGKRKTAFLGTVIFCTEFMHLTLSRIATLDILVAFSALGMFCMMYFSIAELRKNGLCYRSAGYLLLCGCFSACAVATKWTGFYALAGIAVLFLGYLIWEYGSWNKIIGNRTYLAKLFGICVVSFLVIPGCVYFLSYIPYMWSGNPDHFVKITIDNFKLMLSYHKKTVFEHPYSSEWYEWIWNKRPLLDALRTVEDNKISSVATFGNPVIWLGGAAAFLHNMYLWRCRKDKTAAYLCIAYLSMLIPWMFIYRTVFIYQYFICSNILVLLLVNSFCHMKKQGEKRMLLFTAVSGLLFVCFYPVLTGYPVTADYINLGLEWLRSWGLA